MDPCLRSSHSAPIGVAALPHRPTKLRGMRVIRVSKGRHRGQQRCQQIMAFKLGHYRSAGWSLKAVLNDREVSSVGTLGAERTSQTFGLSPSQLLAVTELPLQSRKIYGGFGIANSADDLAQKLLTSLRNGLDTSNDALMQQRREAFGANTVSRMKFKQLE